MIDERLKVTTGLLQELRRMNEEDGADVVQMIWFLYHSGVPKMGALVALRRANVMPVAATKLAVHTHPAYVDRRESDEQFEEALMKNIHLLQAHDHIVAA